jgi:hypothetical protein
VELEGKARHLCVYGCCVLGGGLQLGGGRHAYAFGRNDGMLLEFDRMNAQSDGAYRTAMGPCVMAACRAVLLLRNSGRPPAEGRDMTRSDSLEAEVDELLAGLYQTPPTTPERRESLSRPIASGDAPRPGRG